MKFAVIADWPEVKNAEYEVIKRLQIAAKNIGSECIVVDGQGFEISLNKKGFTSTEVRVTEVSGLDFVFNLHFASPKLFDCFMYATTWNPPKFYHDWGYGKASGNYITADDYCIYQSRPIISQLSNLLYSSRKTLDGAHQMVPSVPMTGLEPLATDKETSVFYSGVNWERLGNEKGRHHELFELLDEEGFMQFYGPLKFLGQRPWAGFKSYVGEIPFDGTSTLNVINKCGISLVLSSDVHRDSHAATNRLYESLEAGAIIISDDNPFVIKNFGDVVLPITYSSSHSKTFEQIKKHVEWIGENRQIAREMALKGQSRYREKYGMELQLKKLTLAHEKRQKTVLERRCVIGDVGKVTIIMSITQFFDSQLIKRTLHSLKRQSYQNFEIVFAVTEEFNEDVTASLNNYELKYVIHKLDSKLMSSRVDDEVIIPRGRVLEDCFRAYELEYVITASQGDVWFSDHLASLLFPIINESAEVSHSGWISEDKMKNRHLTYSGRPVAKKEILCQAHRGRSGTVLLKVTENFRSTSLWFIDDFLESFLCCLAASKDSLGFTQSASLVSYENDLLQEFHLEHNIQLAAINDCLLYSDSVVECLTHGSVLTSHLVEDEEQFKTTLKRILWHKFDKFPRFQRFCQKLNSWV